MEWQNKEYVIIRLQFVLRFPSENSGKNCQESNLEKKLEAYHISAASPSGS